MSKDSRYSLTECPNVDTVGLPTKGHREDPVPTCLSLGVVPIATGSNSRETLVYRTMSVEGDTFRGVELPRNHYVDPS